MVRHDDHLILDLTDRHPGFAAENLAEHAFMLRVQMLNQHKSHACIDRKRPQEVGERFKTSRRGADANHGE